MHTRIASFCLCRVLLARIDEGSAVRKVTAASQGRVSLARGTVEQKSRGMACAGCLDSTRLALPLPRRRPSVWLHSTFYYLYVVVLKGGLGSIRVESRSLSTRNCLPNDIQSIACKQARHMPLARATQRRVTWRLRGTCSLMHTVLMINSRSSRRSGLLDKNNAC